MAIKNIIFDLGGVILDIDYHKTISAFQQLGSNNFEKHFNQAKQSGIFDAFETGKMGAKDFVFEIKKMLPNSTSEQEIVCAWNAMLLDFLPERIAYLEEIRKYYHIFLYSNINAIHQAFVYNLLDKNYGIEQFNDLFQKTYYSHEFGFRKPHPEGFMKIINDNHLSTTETLFIDDTLQHIEAAAKLGIQTLHLQSQSIMDLGL